MLFTNQLRDDAVQVLRSLVGPVRSERGCSHTELISAKEDGAVVTWVSAWNSRSDLDRHLKSTHFRRLLAVMELAAETPDVVFEDGSELRGLDLIHEVIGGAEDSRLPDVSNLDSNIPT
jgi:quinol monooxygenase YgiN